MTREAGEFYMQVVCAINDGVQKLQKLREWPLDPKMEATRVKLNDLIRGLCNGYKAELEADGDLDPEQRSALIDSVDRVPVIAEGIFNAFDEQEVRLRAFRTLAAAFGELRVVNLSRFVVVAN